MGQNIRIRCKNNGQCISLPLGSTLWEAYDALGLKMPYGPTSARVNNKMEGMNFRMIANKDVEFMDVTSASGMRTYTRTLFFILVKATEELFPESSLRIVSAVAKGYYCDIKLGRELTDDDVEVIRQRMRDIVEADLPIRRIMSPSEDAIEVFRKRGMLSKVKLLESIGMLYTVYYKLGDTVDSFYGSLMTSTGGLKVFDLMRYHDGLLLRVPSRKNPTELEPFVDQPKMLEVFQEHRHLQDVVGLNTVGELNKVFEQGYATALVNVAEALQEKKIVRIAEDFHHRKKARIILIAGPSSSGKTTFSKRLSIQLMTYGLMPYPISLDDYFLNRDETPKDENGEYDFESLYALNLPLFNEHMQILLSGGTIELPRYNFQKGKSEMSGKKLHLTDNMVLILEGIHGLNPELTSMLQADHVYRIYVSALTTILLDDHNYIPTTDNRLLRRIIRDYKYRGCSAVDTIRRWPSVRAGEDKWIFPYQENADAVFNSALLFELAVIKNQALPILEHVPENVPEHSEAFRLCKFLRYFTAISDEQIPFTSLLREFVGGSSFDY